MTLQKDQDPGWWRRGMSRRGTIIVVAVALAVIAFVVVVVIVNGIPFF